MESGKFVSNSNDLFGRTGDVMEKIIFGVEGGPKVWDTHDLLIKLKGILAYNDIADNYTMITFGGHRIVEESWFEALSFLYKKGDETICSTFKDLIQANKMLFKIPKLRVIKNHSKFLEGS